MTVIDVDTEVYTTSGTALITAADNWFRAIDAKWQTLADCGSMCGSYSEAVTWAESYDTRADELIRTARMVAEAADNYGRVLIQLGHQHALGDYFATVDAGGTPPEAPTPPPPPVFVCRVPLPAAGGPGQGLLDDGIGLVEQVGIIIPDGDTAKLGTAAAAWAAIAAAPEATALVGELDRIAGAFTAVTAPEVAHIDEDLRALKASAEAMLAACTELAGSCTSHRDGLIELRDGLKQDLADLATEIAKEAAIGAAIGAVSTLVTFGVGGAVAAGVVAGRCGAIIARVAPKIRTLVNTFTSGRKVSAGVDRAVDVKSMQKELDRLRSLFKQNPDRGRRPTDWGDSPGRRAIQDYTEVGSVEVNDALRSGHVSPTTAQKIRDLTEGLAEQPIHQGVVTRQANYPPEMVQQMLHGGKWTEDAFTSSTKLPDGLGVPPWNNSKVTIHIQSSTGRDISGISTRPGELEVMWPPGQSFQRVGDPIIGPDGRIIIFAREVP